MLIRSHFEAPVGAPWSSLPESGSPDRISLQSRAQLYFKGATLAKVLAGFRHATGVRGLRQTRRAHLGVVQLVRFAGSVRWDTGPGGRRGAGESSGLTSRVLHVRVRSFPNLLPRT